MQTDSAVPVAVHGFTWTAALVGLLNLLIGGALVAIIKNWPRLKELAIGQRRDDLDDFRERVTTLEAKVEAATASAHSAEMKLIYAVSAVQLLMGRLQAEAPDDPAIRQARELLAAATSGGMPGFAGVFIDGLHRVKGTNE